MSKQIFFFLVHLINHLLRCQLPYLWFPKSFKICNISWSTIKAEFSSTHFEITTFYCVSDVFFTKTLRRQKSVRGLESFHSNMYFICASHHLCNTNLFFVDRPCQIQAYPQWSSLPLASPPLFFLNFKNTFLIGFYKKTLF